MLSRPHDWRKAEESNPTANTAPVSRPGPGPLPDVTFLINASGELNSHPQDFKSCRSAYWRTLAFGTPGPTRTDTLLILNSDASARLATGHKLCE